MKTAYAGSRDSKSREETYLARARQADSGARLPETEIREFAWGSMDFAWVSMDLLGFPRIRLGFAWICMDLRGLPWVRLDFH